MRKLTTFLMTLLLSLVVSNAFAQAVTSDITANKLTNPSFEAEDVSSLEADNDRGALKLTTEFLSEMGWTVTGSPSVLDLMTSAATATDNNFGTPGNAADGTYMLYLRNSWEDNKEVSVLQSVTLSAGTYKLTVDTKCISSTSSTGTLVAGDESTALTIHTGAVPTDWDTAELTFFLAEDTEVSLGVDIIFKGGEGSFLIDNFKLYQVMPVEEGDYLIMDAEGNYLGGGLTWGTQAAIIGKPQFIGFELNGGAYHLNSYQYNSADAHYLGSNLYFDSTPVDWIIAETEGGYTIYGTVDDGTGYLTSNGFQTVPTVEATPYVWSLVTKEDVIASMAGATEDAPVDVTALIAAPELKRNCNTSYHPTWTVTGYDGTGTPSNYAFGSGSATANCAESYHSTNGFNINQKITLPLAGIYTLSAKGFYRDDSSTTKLLPVLYAGDATSTFPELDTSANTMAEAYAEFLKGLHQIDAITITATSDEETVTIGFKGADTSLWQIFGELELLYLGPAAAAEPYTFEAEDWVASDNNRASADKITYNADGTITVAATGDNNIALGNNPSQVWDATKAWDVTTAKKYITAEQEYFVIIGSDLSTEEGASYWWWLNGINDQSNNSGQIAPDMTVKLTDGQILVAWNISSYISTMTADADGNILLDGGTCFGLTTTGTSSTISDINFYTEEELDDMTKGELVYMTVYSCEAEPVSADDNTPAHWTASPALDNANFHINTWSVEGETDGSEMLTPFVEYWVGAGNGLADEFISHNAISGLEAGTYRVSIDARAYDENNTNAPGEGIAFNVNGTSVDLSTGEQSVFDEKSALVYGTYTIEDIESTDGNLSIRFVVASQENCDWLSWKNLKVEQLVNTRDLELTPAEGKMNATVAATQTAAIEAFYDTRSADDYYAAVEAIEAAEASVAFYEELTNLINTYVAALDEDGTAAWEASASAIGYGAEGENGTLTEDDIDAFMNDLIAAQAAQTTDNTDWSLVMKYTGTWEAPYSNSGTFGIYGDGVESYASAAYTAEEGQILYKTVEGLLPGTYEITLYAVPNVAWITAESGDGIAQVFANNATLDVTVNDQTSCTPSDYEYTLTCIVGEDGVLVFGLQNIATGGNWYVAQEVSLVLVDFATETVDDDDYAIDDEVELDGDTYKILSENLFVNGGFNEKASYGIVPGWTAGNTYTDQLLAENVIIETTGGYNNRGYLTLPESVGASSEHTPTQAIPVNVGSTYLFVGYTSGTEPTDANKRYSALFAMDSATEEAHIVEGTTTYGQDIITLEWGNPGNWEDADADTEWTKTIGTFVATTDYVGMRMNWSLGSYDGFQLYEVESPQVVPGDYLVMNAETGNYLAGGLAWGTQAMEGGKPQFIGFEQVENGLYVLDSYQSNGGDSHYIGVVANEDGSEDVYFDTTGATWMVLKDVTTGTINIGKVVLTEDGEPDMSVAIGWVKTRGFQNAIELVAGRENATDWTLVKKSEIIESMADATADAPVDVTALIPAAEPKRNAWGASWTMTAYDGESAINNGTLGQDWNVASVAESYHSSNGFLFTQIVPELPVGTYKLTAQAFYRNDIADDAELVAPVMYAGEEAAELPELPTELTDDQIAAGLTIPGNMADAYQAFLLEEYPVELEFTVAEEGDVEIGFSSELDTDNQLWTIFGELSLYYLGGDVTVEPEPEPEPTPGETSHECVAEIDHWTIEGNTNGDFHYNDWSTEADASGMVVPFLEYWVWSGEGTLSAATISHETLIMEPGTYEVSLDVRIFSEAGNEITEGTTLTANDASVDVVAAGTADVYGTETEVYGTYTLTCTVGDDGVLDISLDIPEGVTYNWIAIKNLSVTQVEEPTIEPGTVVHECVAEVDHWTIAGNTNGDFHYNDWSVEADASGMVVPFLEYWVWSGEGTLSAATISHETLTDLEPGAYEVTLDIRIFSEAGNEIGEGTTLAANDASVDLVAAGTAGVYGTETEVYGTYTVACMVGEDGTLDISIDIPEGVTYNWIAFKNLTVTYIGEEIPVDNSYQFVCTDWSSIDLGRVSDEDITYDEASNTITVNAGTGANNVALSNGREAPFTTAEYTVSNEQNLFIVVASDIVVDEGASQLWWMNGANDGGSYEPTYVVECDDESGYILVWDLTTTGIDYNLTEDENYLDGWTGFGLTSTNGTSTISDINFYTPDEAVATYPELADVIASEIAGVETEKVVEGIYTLSGVRISKITKSGIYIVDGKKVLVK